MHNKKRMLQGGLCAAVIMAMLAAPLPGVVYAQEGELAQEHGEDVPGESPVVESPAEEPAPEPEPAPAPEPVPEEPAQEEGEVLPAPEEDAGTATPAPPQTGDTGAGGGTAGGTNDGSAETEPEGAGEEWYGVDPSTLPSGVWVVIDFDPQPETLQDVLDILETGALPRWEFPVEEELLPPGFMLKEVPYGDGLVYYSIEFVQREAETREVGTAAALREAFADLVDGDVIVLITSLELGTLAATDGVAAPLTIPSGVHVTLQSGEGGPYSLYRRDGLRHFLLRGVVESTLAFEDVALQGLYAEQNGRLVFGGGIALEECTEVAVTGAVVTGSAAPGGGALCVAASSGVLLQDLRITGAGAQEGGGLALYNSDLRVERVEITDSSAQLGGALYAEGSTLAMEEVLVSGNSAQWGGGLYLSGTDASARGTTLQSNTAYADELNKTAQGGGARLEGGASLNVEGGSISQNTAHAEKADSMGGGVAACGSSTFAASNTLLAGNTAGAGYGSGYGGGLYLGNNNRSTTLAGVTLADNEADAGGAVYLNEGAALAAGHKEAVAFTGNTAAMGGGALCAYSGAEVSLGGGALLEGNTAAEGGDVYLCGDASLQGDAALAKAGPVAVAGPALAGQQGAQPLAADAAAAEIGAAPQPFVSAVPLAFGPGEDHRGDWVVTGLALAVGIAMLWLALARHKRRGRQ